MIKQSQFFLSALLNRKQTFEVKKYINMAA